MTGGWLFEAGNDRRWILGGGGGGGGGGRRDCAVARGNSPPICPTVEYY